MSDDLGPYFEDFNYCDHCGEWYFVSEAQRSGCFCSKECEQVYYPIVEVENE